MELRRCSAKKPLLRSGSDTDRAHAAQQAALLLGEVVAVLGRIDRPLTILRAQGFQLLKGAVQFLAAFRRQRAELVEHIAHVLLLVRRKMLKRFHALQDALLLLWGKTGEFLQTFPHALLAFRRQTAEIRVLLQLFHLLVGRRGLIAAQPVAHVRSGAAQHGPVLA